MTSHARVLIVGDGIMGVGLLHHLALEGWSDVVLVEKGELTSGSTLRRPARAPRTRSAAQPPSPARRRSSVFSTLP